MMGTQIHLAMRLTILQKTFLMLRLRMYYSELLRDQQEQQQTF